MTDVWECSEQAYGFSSIKIASLKPMAHATINLIIFLPDGYFLRIVLTILNFEPV